MILLIALLHYNPCTSTAALKLSKLLATFITSVDFQHVESYSFAQRPTLPNSNTIPLLNTETRRNMSSKVLMAFLVPIVFLHVMKIITTKQ